MWGIAQKEALEEEITKQKEDFKKENSRDMDADEEAEAKKLARGVLKA